MGRYEREVSSGFTKEALAAICAALDRPVDDAGGLPPKGAMRATIRDAVGIESEDSERSFRKADLEAIAAALRAD